MCINCALDGMLGDGFENPNPQAGRTYPRGWDLAGFESPAPFGGLTGSADDDTLRMVYADLDLAIQHMTIAQAFSGHPMEMFSDGKFICFRPAIVKRGKIQPPAWHVVKHPEGYPQKSEMDEIAEHNDIIDFLKSQGIDPADVFGEMPNPDED